jgi:ABC-type transport system involved in cytochrome bd biosynthesis fused ATPase/permease subunit
MKNADRIIVLENGELEEMGTHQELLNLNRIYARIYRTQFVPQEEILLKQASVDRLEGGR